MTDWSPPSLTIIVKHRIDMKDMKITDLEDKFCLVFASGPAPFRGNAQKCFSLVFKGSGARYSQSEEENVADSLEARKLMMREDIRERIDAYESAEIVDASTLRPRLTATLLKIADECSEASYEDRYGTKLSPAAMRAVAVNAISKLTDMYGIKEDIAHKVMLENAGGDGITFNVIVPEAKKQGEDLVG